MADITKGQGMELQATKKEPVDPTIIYMTHENKYVVPTTATRTIITTEDDFNVAGYIFESDIKIEESVMQEFKQPRLIEYLQDCATADDVVSVRQLVPVVRVEKLSAELISNYSQKSMVFECYICRHTASGHHGLKKHLLSHSMTKPPYCLRKVSIKLSKLSKELIEQFLPTANTLECNIGGHRTTRKTHIETHMPSHKVDKPFSCDECKRSYCLKKSLVAHKRLRHDSQTQFLPCRTCKKTFSKNFYLKIHEAKHTGERKYLCKLCPMKFLYKSNLRNHQNTHSEERAFKCHVCSSAFKRAEMLRRHLGIHTGERPFACEYDKCNKTFRLETTLKKHKRTHTNERPFECSICLRKFSQNYILKNHMKTHTGLKSFTCEFCSKSFAEKSTLDNHRRSHTLERPFNCTVCSKSFSRKSTLYDHRKTHSDHRPYSCSICSKAFKGKTQLRAHEKTHESNKFSCDRCSTTFASKISFIGHRRTGDKQFHCAHCDERFEWMCDFKKHLSEKRFECDLCLKKFNRHGEVMYHKKKVHSVQKPYSCKTCSMKFKNSSSWLKHIELKHAV